ncbi:CdaR family transcriptional regulator [Intrasporangium oryzae NRRL B-24470]|uniref:CdaR family transcriptional regulator n=1 Tax=Intrasporangium oryzae NRRL B-24470 TaxID=1386089 RepID=W9GD97_9MICO|nr:helix-turn-helix domain-containing protein [Intrasporangium oryzae]EWT02808.1 CdaR family transcriptional regulator [Intrasporangium oryzae NRRL B-24470]
MVNVANDQAVIDGDLPSPGPAAAPSGDGDVSGISLRLIAGLAITEHGSVHADPERLGTSVDSATPLRTALRDTGDLRHQLVLADASTIEEQPGAAHRIASLVHVLADARAAGLVVAGLDAPDADALRIAATDAGLPLLELPADRLGRFTTEVLGAILEHQTATLRRLEDADRALVQIVLSGGSLDDLCEQVVGFLDGAAMVTTTDGRVIARAGTPGELEWAESLDCFDRTGRLVTENERLGARPDVPDGPGDPGGPDAHRAAVRIVAGHLDHGVLIAFCRNRVLTADDVRLLERAATVAALAITKDQAVAAVESKYRAEFLRDALAGRAGSPVDAIAHATSLGWDIDRPMVVVVAETDEDDDRSTRDAEEVRFLQQRFARAWTHAVAVRDPRAPVMGFSREVVALVGVASGAETDRVMRAVGDLVRVVRGDGGGGRRSFSAGVSRTISSVADLPQAYEEALSAVTVGRQMHGDGALTHVDGLGIYRLLALVPDSGDLRRFVNESLGPLATDDSPEHADLRRTLSILIDTNMNVAETARLLFFHYNTLRYRIAKLEKMLGPFTSDPELRLTLALALKVHQMRGI